MKDLGGILNHAITISNMIKEQKEQDRKHILNPRCKAGNYGGIAAYIEYAFGIACTAIEVEATLKNYNV